MPVVDEDVTAVTPVWEVENNWDYYKLVLKSKTNVFVLVSSLIVKFANI
jgi:hypothetical protein